MARRMLKPEAKAAEPSRDPRGSQLSQVSEKVTESESSPSEVVTVTWGKELVSPKQFHTCEIGPFSSTTAVRPGETRAGAMARVMKELREFAEAERAAKVPAFLASLQIKG